MRVLNATTAGLTLMLAILASGHAYAEIKTQKDADAFLSKYCIELVAVIEDQYEEQKILAVEKKWQKFIEKGALIKVVAEIYSDLCK